MAPWGLSFCHVSTLEKVCDFLPNPKRHWLPCLSFLLSLWGICLPKSSLSVRTEGPFLCKWFTAIICVTSSWTQGLFIFYINSHVIFQQVSFPPLPASCLSIVSDNRFKTGVWAWLSLSPALNLALPLAGAEQAGEMTASCKMQANMVLCIIISPASVSLGYSEITFGSFLFFYLNKEVTVGIIHPLIPLFRTQQLEKD